MPKTKTPIIIKIVLDPPFLLSILASPAAGDGLLISGVKGFGTEPGAVLRASKSDLRVRREISGGRTDGAGGIGAGRIEGATGGAGGTGLGGRVGGGTDAGGVIFVGTIGAGAVGTNGFGAGLIGAGGVGKFGRVGRGGREELLNDGAGVAGRTGTGIAGGVGREGIAGGVGRLNSLLSSSAIGKF